MNYSKIMSFCKKRKLIYLYTADGRQWVSDGGAIYPLLGMPHFDAQSIRAVYDVSESVQVVERNELPEDLFFGDVDMTENQIFMEKIQLRPCGFDAVSFRTQAGVTFIDQKYLSPITGIESDGNVCVYERVSRKTGQIYIAVKRGMLLEAIILPVKILAKDWVEELADVAAAIRATYNREAGIEC